MRALTGSHGFMRKPKNRTLTTRISPSLKKALGQLADKKDMSKSEYMREAINEYIERNTETIIKSDSSKTVKKPQVRS